MVEAVKSFDPSRQVSTSDDLTAKVGSDTILADLTSGSLTVTLPSAAGVPAGRRMTVKRVDATGGRTMTIARAGSDTIDGATSKASAESYAAYTLESDGVSMWLVIGHYSA